MTDSTEPVRRKKKSGTTSDEAAAIAAGLFPDKPRTDHELPVERESTSTESDSARRTNAFGGDWGTIIESVYDLDIVETYKRLTSTLSLGQNATAYGAVLPALDAAESNYFDAVRLMRAAKLMDEEIKREVDKEIEILRSNARDELEREKAEGKRSKAPTLQDIEDRLIANWPKKSSDLRRKAGEMHGTLRACEGLIDAWKSRASTLRMIAEKVSPNR